MFGWIQRLLNRNTSSEADEALLALAAILVQMMSADGRLDIEEREAIASLLQRRYGLDEDQVAVVIAKAIKATRWASDNYQFTTRLIQGFSVSERIEILRELWAVALADGRVSHDEDQLMRRAAKLMGIHHKKLLEAQLDPH